MKKGIYLLPLALIAYITLWAQNGNGFEKANQDKISRTTLAVGTGINSNTGLFGILFEQGLNEHFSGYLAAGLGSWGYKTTAGCRYYFSSNSGTAVGISYSKANGANNMQSKLKVIDPISGASVDKDVAFNALPIHVINLSMLRFWKIGKRNRFGMELGYSLLLSQPANANYSLKDPTLVLSDASKSALSIIQPGGFILGLSFNFGL